MISNYLAFTILSGTTSPRRYATIKMHKAMVAPTVVAERSQFSSNEDNETGVLWRPPPARANASTIIAKTYKNTIKFNYKKHKV